jgi:rubrerythrin
VSVWDQIRDALSALWADWQSPREDERTQLINWLTEAWRAEQRLSTQLCQIIPAIPYEQFRRHLDVMARDDEQHASLIQERLKTLGRVVGHAFTASAGSENNIPSGPWRRLQAVLIEKRELYERYRQAAGGVDDPDLRSLLERLREDEARHQDRLIEMLVRLDAHVHEPMA